MDAILRTLGLLALSGFVVTGCIFRPFEEQHKKDLREERTRNQTLAKAAIILDAVQEWSAKHGGDLPNPTQFTNEVGPYVRGKSGGDVSAAEVEDAFPRFQWTFPGGRVTGTPSEVEVGHLTETHGEAIAYADGSVRRWRPIQPPK
jgi:hypothetical protein